MCVCSGRDIEFYISVKGKLFFCIPIYPYTTFVVKTRPKLNDIARFLQTIKLSYNLSLPYF